MKKIKNLTAFLCVLLVAALGIFLPGMLMQSDGRELLGRVRQANMDYHAGEVDLMGTEEMTMEKKLRLMSDVWSSECKLIWSSRDNDSLPPSLEQLRNQAITAENSGNALESNASGGTAVETEAVEGYASGGNAVEGNVVETEAAEGNALEGSAMEGDSLESKAAEAKMAEMEADGQENFGESDYLGIGEELSIEPDALSEQAKINGTYDEDFEKTYAVIETSAQLIEIVLNDAFYAEGDYGNSTRLELYEYTDSYFGKYRCWCIVLKEAFAVPQWSEEENVNQYVYGGQMTAAFDLETGQLLRLRMDWANSKSDPRNSYLVANGYDMEALFWAVINSFGMYDYSSFNYLDQNQGKLVHRLSLYEDGAVSLSSNSILLKDDSELSYGYEMTKKYQDVFLCLTDVEE